MMSTRDDIGTTHIATAIRNAFTTQIEASGLACNCTAIDGSAVLAMLPSSTDIDSPIRYVNIAQRRSLGGNPSAGAPISLVISKLTSDMQSHPRPHSPQLTLLLVNF